MTNNNIVIAKNINKISCSDYLHASQHLFIDSFRPRPKKLRVSEYIALESISFSVRSSEKVGITGTLNGSESLLGRIIAGISSPTNGDLTIHGKIIHIAKPSAGFKSFLSIEENAQLRLATWGYTAKLTSKKVREALLLANLNFTKDKLLINCSVEEIRQLTYALLIQSDADIYVLDDFFPWLKSPSTLAEKLRVFFKAKTVFFIGTAEQISLLTNRALVLENGKITHDGNLTSEICKYLNTFSSPQKKHSISPAIDDSIDDDTLDDQILGEDSKKEQIPRRIQIESIYINNREFLFDSICLVLLPFSAFHFNIKLKSLSKATIKKVYLQIHSRFNPIPLSRTCLLDIPFTMEPSEFKFIKFEAAIPTLNHGVYGMAIEIETAEKNELCKIARFGFIGGTYGDEGLAIKLNHVSTGEPHKHLC